MDCSAQAQLSFSYSRAAAQWQLLTEENVSRIQGLIFLPRQILCYLCELWLHLDNIVTLQHCKCTKQLSHMHMCTHQCKVLA